MRSAAKIGPGEPAPPEAWAVGAVALPRLAALLSNLLRYDTLLRVTAHRLQAPHLVGVRVRVRVGFRARVRVRVRVRARMRVGLG